MDPIITVIIAAVAVVVTVLIAVPVAGKAAVARKVQQDAEKIGTAEEKARNIIDEALKTAETKKREALLEAKEENLKSRMNRTGNTGNGERNCRSMKSVYWRRGIYGPESGDAGETRERPDSKRGRAEEERKEG